MSIRVSSNQMVYGYQKQLNDANTRQTSLLEQGDGSKLHRPSDSPVDYSKFLRYDTSINENEQYTNNVNTALSWMKTADSALINVTNIQTTFKEKSILAANSTNNGTDMQAIGKEMMAEIQELVSLGNTMQGDRYVFGGQKDLVRPFELSTDEFDRGLAKTLDETQAAYFKTADSSGTMTQMLVLQDEADADNLYYLDTTTGRLYTKDFVENGYKNEKIAGKAAATDDDVVALYQNEEYNHFDVTASDYMNGGYITSTTYTYIKPDGTSETVDFSDYVVVKDSSGGIAYANKDDGKVYTFNGPGAPEEVGSYPGSEYKRIPFTTDNIGSKYVSFPANVVDGVYYKIMTDDGATYYANKKSGVISATPGIADFSETLINDGTIVDDLYATNQKYEWSGNSFTLTATGQLYIGVTDVNDTSVPPTQYYYDKDTREIFTAEYLNEMETAGTDVDSGKSVGNMKSMYVAANFDNRGKILDEDADGDAIVNAGSDYETNIIDEYGRTVTLKMATIKQQLVTYTGDEKQISMVKKNGTTEPTADTVNVTGSEIFGMDLFDDPNSGNSPSGTAMLNEMLTVHAKVVSDDQLWMDTDGVTVADAAHAQTVKTETKMGARTQLYNSVSTMLNTQNELITNDITNVSSTDVARLAVQLMQEQTIYNMSLSLGARILPQSLADYL